MGFLFPLALSFSFNLYLLFRRGFCCAGAAFFLFLSDFFLIGLTVQNKNTADDLNDLGSKHLSKLSGKRIAVWGLAFKPETDDMREAPALEVIRRLLEAGAEVVAYDPVAMDEARRRLGDSIRYARDMYDAVVDADALALLTEWKQFRLPSWGVVSRAMRGNVIVDGRNIYDEQELHDEGFIYHCIGK